MVHGTRTYKLISSYPQSAANYPLVVSVLKDRFEDKVLLVTEVYVRQMLKLVIRNVGKSKVAFLSTMYDELESQLTALETPGVTEEQSAEILYRSVESSLPQEVIRAWQRSTWAGYDDDQPYKPVDEHLKSLMKFLRIEVKGDERLSYVSEGFSEPLREKSVKDRSLAVIMVHPKPQPLGCLPVKRGHILCDKPHDGCVYMPKACHMV